MASVGDTAQNVVLEGPLFLAGLVAIAAGVVSFFSPCSLPLVPGYLSYVTGLAGQEARTETAHRGEGDVAAYAAERLLRSSPATATAAPPRSRRRATTGALLFVAGFATVFTGYGALFGQLGALLFEHQDTLVRILGGFTIAFGLLFSGLLWRVPWINNTFRISKRPPAGLAGAPLMGALFGLGWTPCIGPTLAAVLTLATGTADAGRGAALSFAYSVGLGIPFILVAAGLGRFMRSVTWARRHARAVTLSGGLMLVFLGVLQVTGVWTAAISRMQGFISGWQAPL